MATCVDDFDCEGAEVCYNNMSWANEESFCDCSSWYGAQGPECSEYSIQSYFFIISGCFLICFCASVLIFALYHDVYNIFVKKKLWDWSATCSTWIFAIFSLLGFMLQQIIETLAAANPETVVVSGVGSDEKVSQANGVARFAIFIGVGFVLLGSINVSLMWIEIAQRVKRMEHVYYLNLRRYRYTIYGLQLLALVVAITAIVIRQNVLLTILFAPLNVIIATTYIIARHRFVTLIEARVEFSSRSEVFKKAVVTVKRVSAKLIITICFSTTISTVYAGLILYGWKELSPTGSINFVTIFFQLSTFSYMLVALVLYTYTHNSFTAKAIQMTKIEMKINERLQQTHLASDSLINQPSKTI